MSDSLPNRASGFTRGGIADVGERIRQLDANKLVLTNVAIAPRDQLVRKDTRACCVFCENKFRTFSRRFNCRACGDVVCRNCYRKRDLQLGPRITDMLPVRVCLDCIDHALVAPTFASSSIANSSSSVGDADDLVETSACSSHMKFADGLVGTAPTSTSTSSTTQLEELSAYDEDDQESANGDDTDDGGDASEDDDDGRSPSKRAGSKPSSSRRKRGESTLTSSTSSSNGSRVLELVPEDASVVNFADEFERALIDADEEKRARLLQQYNVAASIHKREYDAICELVARALHCGVAAVAFLTKTCEWYKSKIGISQSQLPREVAFCSHSTTATTADPTIVLDASVDPRFWSNPLVTGSARIRFYASTPIRDPVTNLVLGSVFVMDPEPKTRIPSRAMEVLAYASASVEKLLVLSLQDPKRRTSARHGTRVSESAASLMASDFAPTSSKRSLSARTTTSDRPGVKLLDSDELLTSLRHSTGGVSLDLKRPTRGSFSHPPPGDMLAQIETTQQLLSSLRLSQGVKRPTLGEVEV